MTPFVVADSGIRQLYARFIDAAWRKDADSFAACFAPDGEWKIANMHMRGRAAIVGGFARLLASCKRVRIILGQPVLEIGEGTASGRVPITEFVKLADDSSAMTLGVYYDRYVQEGDRWLFQWRHLGLHYRGPIDLSGDLSDCPDYGPPPAMPGPDEPTFTSRPS